MVEQRNIFFKTGELKTTPWKQQKMKLLYHEEILDKCNINFIFFTAEIGGQVGLCVGASLLTVLEFCDVIIAIIGIRFGFR